MRRGAHEETRSSQRLIDSHNKFGISGKDQRSRPRRPRCIFGLSPEEFARSRGNLSLFILPFIADLFIQAFQDVRVMVGLNARVDVLG